MLLQTGRIGFGELVSLHQKGPQKSNRPSAKKVIMSETKKWLVSKMYKEFLYIIKER